MSRYMAPALVAWPEDLIVYKVEDGEPVDPKAPRGMLHIFSIKSNRRTPENPPRGMCHNPDNSGPPADVCVAVQTILGGLVEKLVGGVCRCAAKMAFFWDYFRMYVAESGQF